VDDAINYFWDKGQNSEQDKVSNNRVNVKPPDAISRIAEIKISLACCEVLIADDSPVATEFCKNSPGITEYIMPVNQV